MTAAPAVWTDGDIEGVALRPLRFHGDARGWLTEVFRSDETPPDLLPAMAYLSMTRPGMARGPHAHRRQTDCFAFLGPGSFELRVWDPRDNSPTRGHRATWSVGEGNPVVVVVPPGVVHGYRNTSDRDGLVINLPNRLYGGPGRAEPVDEIRYENDPASGFVL